VRVLESAATARLATRRRAPASPARVVAYAAALAAAIVAVQITANLVDFGVYAYRFPAVDPNNEGSLFAWVGGFAIAVAAVACCRLRARYLTVAALLAIVCVENRVRFEEATVHRPVVYAPLLGSVFAGLLLLSREWPSPSRRAVQAGLAALVFSLALHKLAPHVLLHYGYGPGSWPYEVKVSLKESGELCGWILVAAALLTQRLQRQ
jgi:hypothetical protein